ncbi:MAG: hypothetical protein KC496_03610 [Anaerolineae bacterium]|nr:hypothetical protein [Anaerolineae bacterium]
MPDQAQIALNIQNAQTALALGLFNQILPTRDLRDKLKLALGAVYLGLDRDADAVIPIARELNALLVKGQLGSIVTQADHFSSVYPLKGTP